MCNSNIYSTFVEKLLITQKVNFMERALALLKKNGVNLPIYSDSRIAISWIKQKVCKTNLQKNRQNEKLFELILRAENWLKNNSFKNKILKWETKAWGEIPADFGRK